MADNLSSTFLAHAAAKLGQLNGRIGECLGRLSYEQIWARGGENENAVGNLVLHLCGNVRQWIGYGVGGLDDVRKRDEEFAARGQIEPAELKERLAATVRDAVQIIDGLTPEQLAETVTIQKYRVTKLEAVCHVIEHFAEHTGQIIFVTKQLTGADLGFYRHLSGPAHREKTP